MLVKFWKLYHAIFLYASLPHISASRIYEICCVAIKAFTRLHVGLIRTFDDEIHKLDKGQLQRNSYLYNLTRNFWKLNTFVTGYLKYFTVPENSKVNSVASKKINKWKDLHANSFPSQFTDPVDKVFSFQKPRDTFKHKSFRCSPKQTTNSEDWKAEVIIT